MGNLIHCNSDVFWKRTRVTVESSCAFVNVVFQLMDLFYIKIFTVSNTIEKLLNSLKCWIKFCYSLILRKLDQKPYQVVIIIISNNMKKSKTLLTIANFCKVLNFTSIIVWDTVNAIVYLHLTGLSQVLQNNET